MVKQNKKKAAPKPNPQSSSSTPQQDEGDDARVLFPIRPLPSLESMESYPVLRIRSGLFPDTSADALATLSTTEIEAPKQVQPEKKGKPRFKVPKIIVSGSDSNELIVAFQPSDTQVSITAGSAVSSVQEKKKKAKGKVKVLATYYSGKQHSDMDVQVTRPPMAHRINILEWLWLYHTNSRVNIFIIAGLFSVLLLHVGFAVWLFSLGEKVEAPHICDTKACKQLGDRIKRTLNRSVNPCDDFSAFVCGSSDISSDLTAEEEDKWKYGNDAGRVQYDFGRSRSLGRMLRPSDEFPHNLVLPMYKACLQEDKREADGLEPFYDLLKRVNLYHISRDNTTLTGANVIDSMARILSVSLYDSAILRIIYYTSSDGKIKAYIAPPTSASNAFRGGFVYRYGYQLYHDTIRDAFKMMDQLKLTQEELEILPHDILCLDIYLTDLFYKDNKIIDQKGNLLRTMFFPDGTDINRELCEIGPTFDNPRANFGHPGSGDFDSKLLVKTMYAIANPGWNGTLPPEYDHLDPENDDNTEMFETEFLPAFKEIFRVSAPIRLCNDFKFHVRFLQWRILVFMSFELNQKAVDVMINVRRHVYIGRMENCFHALFTWLPFLAADKFLYENSDVGLEKTEDTFNEHSTRLLNTYKRMILGSNFTDFERYYIKSGKTFDDQKRKLFKRMLHSHLQVENIPPPAFRAKNFPAYRRLYDGISFGNSHVSNILQIGYRIHQWKTVGKFSKIFFDIDSKYRRPILIDKSRSKYEITENSYITYLPLASIESPFFNDGLVISDASGLGAIMAIEVQKTFMTSTIFGHGNLYLRAKLKPEFSLADIQDMHSTFLSYIREYILNERLHRAMNRWKMGNLILGRLKYDISRFRVLVTLLKDINSYHVLATKINAYLADPSNKREAQYVLQDLEEFNEKQLFYITLVGRKCEKFGQKEFRHISQYGPLPQTLRFNIVLSNLGDFAETFQCPLHSPMNSPDRYNFWDEDSANVTKYKHTSFDGVPRIRVFEEEIGIPGDDDVDDD